MYRFLVSRIMFCCVTLGPGIHVDVTMTCTTYLSIIADQVHPFIATVFPNVSDLFQQDTAMCPSALHTIVQGFTEPL